MRKLNAVTGLYACPVCESTEAEGVTNQISGVGCVYCPVCLFSVGAEAWEGGVTEARRAWNSGDFEVPDEDDE